MSPPIFLPPGRRLGIFSPAGPSRVDLAPSLEILRKAGYLAEPPSEAGPPFRKYLAAPDEARLASLEGLWANPSIDACLARRGGYGCQRLLGALGDFSRAPEGKPVIGFSDLTALHLARYKLTGAGGWHAPMADGLQRLSKSELGAYFAAIRGDGAREWRFPEKSVLRPGPEAKGPLLGGNLATICALLASGRLPSFKGAILMLEDVAERGHRLDRLLSSLTMSGMAASAAGVVFGAFIRCGPKESVSELLREFALALPKGVPAVMGAPFGHGLRNRPWWVGETSSLSAGGGRDGGAAGHGGGLLKFLGQ